MEVRWIERPRDARGEILGGACIRERRIILDAALRRRPGEGARILAHELFHFAWVRLGNPARHAWEKLLAAELRAGARGELGWSAEWRKEALGPRDAVRRTRRWREYCAEGFCDTGAWLSAGLRHHAEYTLAARWRVTRREWFMARGLERRISI